MRLHPSTRPACRHERAHLEPSDLPARLAAHLDRQSAIAEAGKDHRGQVEYRTAVAAGSVTRELVLVTVDSSEGAEVDHGLRVAPMLVNRLIQIDQLRHSPINCCAAL